MRTAISCIWILCGAVSAAAEPRLELATFSVDITPTPGAAICVGFIPRVNDIEAPLEARGIVVRMLGQDHVICAFDCCGICAKSDHYLRKTVAAALGTGPNRVAMQSLHQHTAPVLDTDASKLLHGKDSFQFRSHEDYLRKISQDIAAAVATAKGQLQPVTSVSASRSVVDRVASNRRVSQPDGSLKVRLSSSRDADLIAAPEGLIDPWLRTLTFFRDDRPLVQMHYYATHPQTIYGNGRIGWDVPGMTRRELEQETKVFQIYFNGCGGNLAMGKYNRATEDDRAAIAERLFDAMQRASRIGVAGKSDDDDRGRFDATFAITADTPLDWRAEPWAFEERNDDELNYDEHQKLAVDQSIPVSARIRSAQFVSWVEWQRAGHKLEISRWRIGPIQIIHLPGEPFVEWQLFAQKSVPESFVCVAGYGDCGVWYYGPDSIYSDRGGYEQTWSFTAPCQERLERLLTDILDAKTSLR